MIMVIMLTRLMTTMKTMITMKTIYFLSLLFVVRHEYFDIFLSTFHITPPPFPIMDPLSWRQTNINLSVQDVPHYASPGLSGAGGSNVFKHVFWWKE